MKNKVYIAMGIIFTVALLVFFNTGNDSRPSTFVVQDRNLIIGGSYGLSVTIDGISDLELTDVAPVIQTKINGSVIGSVCRGEFLLENGVRSKLFADVQKPPYIRFTRAGTVFYINLATPEKTREMFQRLIQSF